MTAATANAAARVTEAFRTQTGREPGGVWWAPGRVNLIGEHTDYNDGYVLPLAIARGTFAAVARRDDSVLRACSVQEGDAGEVALDALRPGRMDGWVAYVAGMAWALREAGVALGGVDVTVDSTLPQESGLSSSAALECSVGLALVEAHGARLDRIALARAAQRAENEAVGVSTGLMDQLASLLGRGGHALFVDIRSLETEHVPLDLDGDVRLLVLDTRAPRRLVEGAYDERRAACEAAARELGVPALRDATPEQVDAAAAQLGDVGYRRARHVVTENERVLRTVEALRAGDMPRVGALLDESHRSLRDDFEVSSPELDAAVEAAVEAGALGARMTGAGFGGSALALAPAGRADAVRERVTHAFAERAFREPEVFAVTAADGARRVV